MASNKKSGFIKLILLIVVVILVLSYFGVNLRNVANSDAGQANFSFLKETCIKVWDWIVNVWQTYLADKASYLWNDVYVKYVWVPFTQSIDKIHK